MKTNYKNKFKHYWKQFWYLLWKDDSLKGWIFSLIVIFIFIKFVFFPTLNLVTGTSLPLAIVESCSMYHKGNLIANFNNWFSAQEEKYEEFDITKEQFSDYSFKKGFNKGDILFVLGTKAENLELGDVIIFNGWTNTPIIHRIVKIKEQDNALIFSTIGDNNNGQLFFEKQIHENQIIGKAVFRLVPYAGWGKLIFFDLSKPSGERGFCN